MSEDIDSWERQPVNTIIWREDLDTRRRWLSIAIQLFGMQRDIAQRQVHGPGSTKMGM